MIIRIFQVTINPEYREDFERDFRTISVDTVQNHNGLISWHIAGPTKWNPDDYVMVTYWEDEDSLVAFAGENWNQAVIPPKMKKYPRSFSVTHYKNNEGDNGESGAGLGVGTVALDAKLMHAGGSFMRTTLDLPDWPEGGD